jgi:hypothetical protein
MLGVIGDGGVEVDGVDVGISEDICVVGVAFFDAIFVADFIERGFGALANGGHFCLGVTLVDGDEFGSESKSDDGDANGLI